MKRGQGLSLTTIIIAAIALIVLIILVLIFTGNIGGWNKGTSACESRGGRCSYDPNNWEIKGVRVAKDSDGDGLPDACDSAPSDQNYGRESSTYMAGGCPGPNGKIESPTITEYSTEATGPTYTDDGICCIVI